MTASLRPSTLDTRDGVPTTRPGVALRALIALDVLAVLLQGLWAGLFLERDGARDAAGQWIDVHARGGEVALILTVVVAVVAFLRSRQRRDLWGGAVVLALLLALEAYLGGLIRDDGKDTLTAVHVPLAMLIMGVTATLAVRANREA
jgi:hypothetical protein